MNLRNSQYEDFFDNDIDPNNLFTNKKYDNNALVKPSFLYMTPFKNEYFYLDIH